MTSLRLASLSFLYNMICLFGYSRCVTFRHVLCHAPHHVISAITVTLSFLRDFTLVTLYVSPSISRDFSSPYCSSTHKSYLVTLRCCLCHVTFLMSRSFLCICIRVTLSLSRDFNFVTAHTSRLSTIMFSFQRDVTFHTSHDLCLCLLRSALHYFFALSRSCYHVTSLRFSLAFISVTHHLSLCCHALPIT